MFIIFSVLSIIALVYVFRRTNNKNIAPISSQSDVNKIIDTHVKSTDSPFKISEEEIEREISELLKISNSNHVKRPARVQYYYKYPSTKSIGEICGRSNILRIRTLTNACNLTRQINRLYTGNTSVYYTRDSNNNYYIE